MPSRRADVCSLIVERHQAREIEGYLVDVVTARLLLAVYAKLSPTARQRFDEPQLYRLVDFCWKQVKK